ncbi:hypothetical protein CRENBAI_019358 [Crenichthys baileyi]|uniref:Uncharacterized protein n=1 Tax=Crenichthys baileyi TaxID=28760 RepID=A0AAV9R8U1_9TELE
MIPPTVELADSRQESARDQWFQQQMEEAMKHLPTDLEVVPSPLLLEEMELAPAGPGSGRGAVNLFTFLSREAEKTLRRSAGLSVPQSAFDGSSLAIPCPGIGPLRRRSLPAPLALHSGPALKPSPSSRRKKRRSGAPSCSTGEEVVSLPADVRAAASKPASSPATAPSPRLAAAPPMPSSLTPARCSEATPEELEEQLRFFARQIKTFRKTSLMYSSPELMERIRQMERDYETAVRQFNCRPPSTPGLQGAAGAAEQSTPGLQGAVELSEGPEGGLPPLPGPEHLLSFLWGVLTELKPDTPQSDTPHPDTPQPVSAKPDTPQPDSARSDTPQPDSARSDTPQPNSARSDTPQPDSARSDNPQPDSARSDNPQPDSARSDTPQPDSARSDTPQPDSARSDSARSDTPQPDTPQPDTGSDPKSASTFSTRRRGRRKRDASVHATRGLCDASAPAHATEGLCDASAPSHATEGPADALAPAYVTEGPADSSALAHVTEGPADSSALAHVTEGPADASASANSLQGFSGKLVLVLASEPCDEGLEDEEPPDPVSGDFKGQFVLVLASEPRDEGSPGSALASEGSPGSASASEGSPGSASASEGSPGSASASEGSPGSASASEGSPGSASASEVSPGSASEGSPGIRSRRPELCACSGRPPGRPPELCACSGRPPGRPPELCACSGRPPGRLPELCACFWPSCHGPPPPVFLWTLVGVCAKSVSLFSKSPSDASHLRTASHGSLLLFSQARPSSTPPPPSSFQSPPGLLTSSGLHPTTSRIPGGKTSQILSLRCPFKLMIFSAFMSSSGVRAPKK